jgi:hypothetical protein
MRIAQELDSSNTVPVNVIGSVGPIDTELTTADLDTGAGTDTRAVVGLVYGASGGGVLVSATNPMPVGDNGGSLTVDGTVTANAGTGPFPVSDNAGSLTVDAPVATPVAARLSDGTAFLTTAGGKLSVDASGVALPVTDNAGSLTVDAPVGTPVFTQLSDGTTALTTPNGSLNVNQARIGDVAIAVGSGVLGTGTQRVVLATDQPVIPVSDNAGSLTVDGTVTANIGTAGTLALDASITGLEVAQGSTTSGQKGGLVQGAVTTSAPTYTTAQTSPLSINTFGAQRVDAASCPPAADILCGRAIFAVTTAATTLITIPAGRTWYGTIGASCSCSVAPTNTGAGNAKVVFQTAGTNVTPAAGIYFGVEAKCSQNSATGISGTQGDNFGSTHFVVVAPAGNSVTLDVVTTQAGSATSVDAFAAGRLI